MTATSIGITVRVLADLKRQHSREGQIVLGAAGLALSHRFFFPLGVALRADPVFARRIEDQMKPVIHLFTPIFFVMKWFYGRFGDTLPAGLGTVEASDRIY